MRVDPFYTYHVSSALGSTESKIEDLTNELGSGSRVNSLSDDPIAASQNEQLLSQVSRDDNFTRTATQVEGRLQVVDTALSQVVSELTTAVSVATQGINGTSNSTNFTATAEALIGIRDEVMALGNTTYLGQYVFAGTKTSTVPFVKNSVSGVADVVTYAGDNNVTAITTPAGQTININSPGDKIFTGSPDLLNTLNNLIYQFQSAASAGNSSAVFSSVTSNITTLTSSIGLVSTQRTTLDNYLTRVQSASSYASAEKTQLLSAQTGIMQADLTKVASDLSLSQAQKTALSSVFTTISKGSLFDYL